MGQVCGTVITRGEDRNVLLLQSFLHHQVIVTDAKKPKSLKVEKLTSINISQRNKTYLQSVILDLIGLITEEIVDGFKNHHLCF